MSFARINFTPIHLNTAIDTNQENIHMQIGEILNDSCPCEHKTQVTTSTVEILDDFPLTKFNQVGNLCSNITVVRKN
jgi:hypothetical protein